MAKEEVEAVASLGAVAVTFAVGPRGGQHDHDESDVFQQPES
jgi:hypothetical protein